jgi:hypothetical protein
LLCYIQFSNWDELFAFMCKGLNLNTSWAKVLVLLACPMTTPANSKSPLFCDSWFSKFAMFVPTLMAKHSSLLTFSHPLSQIQTTYVLFIMRTAEDAPAIPNLKRGCQPGLNCSKVGCKFWR